MKHFACTDYALWSVPTLNLIFGTFIIPPASGTGTRDSSARGTIMDRTLHYATTKSANETTATLSCFANHNVNLMSKKHWWKTIYFFFNNFLTFLGQA